jgi:hypothetical protein
LFPCFNTILYRYIFPNCIVKIKYLVPDSFTTEQAKPTLKESVDSNSETNVLQINFQFLYWADGVSEIVFIVPGLSCSSTSFISCIQYFSLIFFYLNLASNYCCDLLILAPFHESSTMNKSTENILGTEKKNVDLRKRLTKDSTFSSNSEVRMLVVWCESYDDHRTFPIGKFSLPA